MTKPTMLGLALAMLLLVLLVACGDPATPAETPKTYSRAVYTHDHLGQQVARFVFEQTSTSTASRVNLKIQNLRNTPFCVNYSVFFQLNFAAWQYRGDVRNLPAGGVVDAGTVSSNRARVDLGSFWIRFDTPVVTGC